MQKYFVGFFVACFFTLKCSTNVQSIIVSLQKQQKYLINYSFILKIGNVASFSVSKIFSYKTVDDAINTRSKPNLQHINKEEPVVTWKPKTFIVPGPSVQDPWTPGGPIEQGTQRTMSCHKRETQEQAGQSRLYNEALKDQNPRSRKQSINRRVGILDRGADQRES